MNNLVKHQFILGLGLIIGMVLAAMTIVKKSNIDDRNYFLSNINLDGSENNQTVFYEVKNVQQLNSIISKEFKKVKLD